MKKIVVWGLLALLPLAFALSGCGTGVKKVVEYNDKLIDLQNSCYDAEATMMAVWGEENYETVRTLYPNVLETCMKSQGEIAAMDAYKGDSSMRDAFDAELQVQILYLQKLGEVIAYWEYDEEELTEEQQAAIDALWEEIDILDRQLEAAFNTSVAVQEAFAEKYWYTLE